MHHRLKIIQYSIFIQCVKYRTLCLLLQIHHFVYKMSNCHLIQRRSRKAFQIFLLIKVIWYRKDIAFLPLTHPLLVYICYVTRVICEYTSIDILDSINSVRREIEWSSSRCHDCISNEYVIFLIEEYFCVVSILVRCNTSRLD